MGCMGMKEKWGGGRGREEGGGGGWEKSGVDDFKCRQNNQPLF